MTPRTRTALIGVALAVALIEMGATYAGVHGDPMALVDGWAPTRPIDAWAFVLAAVGCGALFVIARYPAVATVVAASAYILFSVRDYEFGMTLPAMVAVFILALRGQRRVVAVVAAPACLAASLVWVAQRTSAITDEGVPLLAWVAFGTVSAVFFLVPLLLGDLIRVRRQLRATVSAA